MRCFAAIVYILIATPALAYDDAGLYADSLYRRMKSKFTGALAGEIGAYITLLKPMQTADSFRRIATIERKERVRVLRAMRAPPNTHPVFSAVAHKIGLLSALDIPAFYNVVTGPSHTRYQFFIGEISGRAGWGSRRGAGVPGRNDRS